MTDPALPRTLSLVPALRIDSEKAQTGTYWAGLDLLRFVAMLAVIWIHAVETDTLKIIVAWCRFAVPAFTAASILLFVVRHCADRAASLFNYICKRSLRIYALFLGWNLFYAGARLIEHQFARGKDPIRWNVETILLAGFAEHLWFLPFLIFAALLAAPIGYFISHSERHWVKCSLQVAAVALGVTLTLIPSPFTVDLDRHPATYWAILSWQAIPSALLVFAFLAPPSRFGARVSHSPKTAVACFSLAVLLLGLSLSGTISVLLQNLAGLCLFMTAITAPCHEKLRPLFRQLGSLALPTYLIHVLFLHGLQTVGHRFLHLPSSTGFDLSVFAITVLTSGAFASSFSRLPITRRLLSI